VLVVDDHEATRITISAILEEDFTVTAVDSVSAAQAALAREDFEVVIADYILPDASGLTLLDRLHTVRPDAIGILVTGHGTHDEVQRARTEFRYRVIIKPYDPQALVESVKHALSIARLKRATKRMNRSLGE
jgi:two-component system C4-dicarboxylate transport response regulator DctD